MLDPYKIEFDPPMTLGGKSISSLTLRCPLVADAVAVQDAQKAGRDTDVLVIFICRLSGLTRKEVEQISVDQLSKFEAAMSYFFPDAAKEAAK